MKAIFVDGEDYAALNFEDYFKGKTVQEVIDSGVTQVEEDDYYFEITVLEVGDVSEKFLNFVRNKIVDYETSKHENFWLEGEVI